MKWISVVLLAVMFGLVGVTMDNGNVGAGVGAGLLGMAIAILEKDEVE